jgi:radical SAM protein with 4Fe4S-binding SPASM domain
MLDIKLKLKPGHTSEREWMAPSPLQTLYWNVTYACNHRCPICFTDAGAAHPDELTTAEARAMLDRAHDAGIRDVIVSGGEPFARSDLLDLLVHMADLGIGARIATNGTLLSDAMLDRVRHDTLTRSFQVSVDSLDPGLYGEMHGAPAGSPDAALRALRGIQERGFHTTISVRLTRRTLPGIPQLLERACEDGWSTVTVHCPVHTRRAEAAPRQDADFVALLAPVFESFRAIAERWIVETYIPWVPYHPVMQRLQEGMHVVHRGCRAGRDRLAVHPSGAVSPCVCLDVPEAHIGNVRRDDLGELFRASPLCEMLRRPAEHGICSGCPNVASCGGGCRAAAFAATGRLDGQDEACPVWRAAQGARSHGA